MRRGWLRCALGIASAGGLLLAAAPQAAGQGHIGLGSRGPSKSTTGSSERLVIEVSDGSLPDPLAPIEVVLDIPAAIRLARLRTGAGTCWKASARCRVPSGETSRIRAVLLVTSPGSRTIEITATGGSQDGQVTHEHPMDVTGAACTRIGSLADDGLRGTTDRDVLCGFDGHDRLWGRAGPDLIRAARGDDTMSGGGGDDTIDGGRGADEVTFAGGPRGVTVDLRRGVARGHGHDRVRATERITGTARRDTLRGSGRADVMRGKGGRDTLTGLARRDRLEGGRGEDLLAGGRGRDRLLGGAGIDVCTDPRASRRSCERRRQPRPVASAGAVELFAVAAEVILHGFHESLFDVAVALEPLARGYVVMSSRGRGTASTSALDVAVPEGAAVRSPVSGKVVKVRQYRLYCRTSDTQIVIRPSGQPHLRVWLVHVRDPLVQRGDRVVYGYTRIAAVRRLPFSSQIERYVDGSPPHVHVEVTRGRRAPVPGCR